MPSCCLLVDPGFLFPSPKIFVKHRASSPPPTRPPIGWMGSVWMPVDVKLCVVDSGGDSIGQGVHVPPTFTNGWARGHRELKNSKQETDQTVLTIAIALTKTTNCTFRAKKVEGHDQQTFFRRTVAPSLLHRTGAPSPHFQIQINAFPPTSHLQFFLHINFPPPVSLAAQM